MGRREERLTVRRECVVGETRERDRGYVPVKQHGY